MITFIGNCISNKINYFFNLFQMVELSPGSRVFVYQTSVDVASKKALSAAACFLLSCFFSNSELVGSNLTGANGKRQLNQQVIDAIVGKFQVAIVL